MMETKVSKEIKEEILKLISTPGVEVKDIVEKVKLDYDTIMDFLFDEEKIGIGTYFPIMIAILIFGKTIFLNRVVIPVKEMIKEEPTKIQEIQISGKIYCSSCGAEILDKTGDFCSKCERL